MKLRQLTIALSLVGASTVGIVSCGGSSNNYPELSATIEIFDGFALGCSASVNGVAASEVGNGVYKFSGDFPDGAVVTATNCTDADTGTKLSTLKGVSVGGASVVSPFTTMIVSAVQAGGGDPANLSSEALNSAKASIVTKLGLGSYDPTNPSTANYVAQAATDSTAGAVMQKALAVTTLLKAVEKAAGSNATTAVNAVVNAIIAPTSSVDLTSAASLNTILTSAGSSVPSVAAALTSAAQITTIVSEIATATSVGQAAGITKVVGESLDSLPDDGSADLTSTAAIDTSTAPSIDVGTGSGNTGTGTGATGGTGGSS